MTQENEQRQGPINIFDDIPIEDMIGRLEERSNDWDIVFDDTHEDGQLQDVQIRSGKTGFKFQVLEGWSELKWSAGLPEALKPGGGYEGYDKIVKYISDRFPRMVLNAPSKLDLRENYIGNSEIFLTRFGQGQKPKGHSLRTEEGRVRFAIDFTSSPRTISRISVIAKPYFSNDFGHYVLEVRDPLGQKETPQLSLSLPVQAETVDIWGGELAKWVIYTHKDKEGVEDVGVAAKNLGDVLTQRMEIAMGRTI